MGSILNIAGNYYDEDVQRILNRTDGEALASDWAAVGRDIRTVSKRLK